MKKNNKLNISRRILCALLFIFLAISTLTVQSFAANDAGAEIEWRIEGDRLIISGKGEMRDFSENDTPPWHKHRRSIRAVIVNDGVESIGDLAFYKYDNLVSVSLAKSVKNIGAYAFSDCTSIEMIDLGGVQHIEKSAFARCSSLTSIRLPSSLKSIEDKAFYRCSGLLAAYIPSSVSYLGNMIFTYCDKLLGASVQASVDSVPEWMFYGCSNLSEVVLGGNIASAEDQAFYGCESFTALYYPSGNENTLVESIKSTSIEYFSDQNLRSDTPTDGELEGANTVIQDNLIIQTNTQLFEGEGSMISTHITNQTKFDNGEFIDISSSVSMEALVDGETGWDELLSKIQNILDREISTDGSINVLVNLQTGQSIPSEILSELSDRSVQIDVLLSDGSFFGVDCERVDSNGVANAPTSLGCTVTKEPSLSEKHKDILEGAETYKISYNNDIDVNFSSKIFVGKENAHSVATIYVEKSDGKLERLQSAVIDKDGYATFYLHSVSADAKIVLGVNVNGETVENAIIPDSAAVDNSDLLDRYRPIEYAITDQREFMGLNSWQFALVVFGVIAGIVIITSVIAVIIYRKKKLQLIHKMQKR